MQQLSRNLRQVEPIVQHGIQELQAGAPFDHTLREIALMATLVGAGISVREAIRAVEQAEPQLLSYGGYERAEPQMHGGVYGKTGVGMPVGYAKPMPAGYGKPVGYGMQPTAYGKGVMPYGVPMGGIMMGR
ncbi:MAG: hypothetical protein K0R39_1587 [Symbiobacteriaceae bacterium]|jgi:hypothetical protein|nr:hypothetical protein [Symbiobacteriaceae bacterium]